MAMSVFNNLKEFYFDKIDNKCPFSMDYVKKFYGINYNFVNMDTLDIPNEFNNLKQLLTMNINGKNIDNIIKSISLYDISSVNNSLQIKKLHQLYSIYISFYVKYNDEKKIIIPYNLSIPILYIFRQSNIAPILTYSDLILNNTRIHIYNDKKNIEIDYTFTNSIIERKYYTNLLKIELSGGKILNNIFDLLNSICEGDKAQVYLENISIILKEYITLLSNYTNDEKKELSNIFSYQKKYNLLHYFGEKYILQDLDSPYNFYDVTIAQSPLIQILNIFLMKNSVHIKNNIYYCFKEHQNFILDFEKYLIDNKITEYLDNHYESAFNECKDLFDFMLNEYISIFNII